mgnify:CR=1 FL=1
MKTTFKLLASSCIAGMLAVGGINAQAQTFPSKPFKFVVPFPAGSATDSVGRIVAQAMSDALGQPIAVDNKAGANGIPGADFVKSATADPYTLLVTTSTTQAALDISWVRPTVSTMTASIAK